MTASGRWKLASRLLLRDWRAGELNILLAALIIAVAASTAITFFTDRIGHGMSSQSADFLGADLALLSSSPVDDSWLQEAETGRLKVASTLEFASVVVAGDALQLASVKAVDQGYPTRGSLRTASAPFAADEVTHSVPQPGEAWTDSRLLARLGIQVGDNLEVGEISLRISRVLTFEPGQAGDLFGISPRLLINQADVAATGVVQPGSRLSWQYLFAGTAPDIKQYRKQLLPRLQPGHKLVGAREGRRAVGNALDRAERFLGLSVLVAIVLAGVAIAMAARRYSERHFDMSAMLRCLGASQGDLLGLYIPQLIMIGVFGSLLGCFFGWLAQFGLFYLLTDVLPIAPTEGGLRPLLTGLATGMVTLAGFALPPVMRLKNVPPLRVLRRDLIPLSSSAWLVYGIAVSAIVVLMWRYTGNWQLTLTVLAGAAAAVVVLGLLSFALLTLGRGLKSGVGVAWRFGINNLWRRSGVSLGQILAFGLTLMAMAIIALVRTDLLTTWQNQLPQDAPNQFAINILPDKVEGVQRFFAERNIQASALYPLVRGRLIQLNGLPVRQAVSKEARADNALHRDLNLTWTGDLQEDNRIVSGRWFQPEDRGKPLVSVEARLAIRLGIKLGDQLVFSVAGGEVEARVISIRTVQWDSFRPNFYMVFPPGVLEEIAATYMTSFHLQKHGKSALIELVREFPAVTVLELDLIMEQVDRILQQVTLAVEYVLTFVLLAGFAVLFAALQASLDERLYEGALLRALGASRRQLRAGHLAEFMALGVMAGLVAAIGSECVAWLLYSRVLHLDYSFKWQIWVSAPLVGALLIGAAGYWGTRRVVQQSPIRLFYRL